MTAAPATPWRSRRRAARERGQRLTPIRRDVLGALLASHQPLGAYEIMERVAPSGPRPAPITVYRALEFLRENGLVHRIESRNAFVACVHSHADGDLVVFLICERCGTVGEASSSEVASDGEIGRRCGRLHAEIAGDRGQRHLHALRQGLDASRAA